MLSKIILPAMPNTVHTVFVLAFVGVMYGSPSGAMGGGGVGCLPHEGHPAKDPLGDGVLVIDDIHERRLACLHINNNNLLQAFQLIVLARYLLGVPKP